MSKQKEWTLKQFEREVRRLDPNVEPDSDYFKTAVVMLAALQRGQNVRQLARFTRYPVEYIKERADNLKSSGVWHRGRTAADDWFGENGALAFWLDVAVAEGMLKRAR